MFFIANKDNIAKNNRITSETNRAESFKLLVLLGKFLEKKTKIM